MIAIICLERGMSSKRVSSGRVDYVPVICTHRPSLLPIGLCVEFFGADLSNGFAFGLYAKLNDIRKLEEAKVVTRLL